MDDKKAEITCCNFSQTCSSPGARELHECRYGSSLIQFLLDYMHIRNALTPELDRSGIDKVDREVIRFFFEKVRKEAGLLSGSDRDMAELQGNPPPTPTPAAAFIPFSPNCGWTTSVPQWTSMAASTNVKGGISIPFPASPGSPAVRQTNISPDHCLQSKRHIEKRHPPDPGDGVFHPVT